MSAQISPIFSEPKRDEHGRFLPGHGGRPPNSRNRVSSEALAAVKSMKDEAIERLRQRLENNDWAALQFVLERVLPKGRVLEIDATSPSAIIEALSSGTMTTDEAANLAKVLQHLATIEETTELRKRIEHLERIANEKK